MNLQILIEYKSYLKLNDFEKTLAYKQDENSVDLLLHLYHANLQKKHSGYTANFVSYANIISINHGKNLRSIGSEINKKSNTV